VSLVGKGGGMTEEFDGTGGGGIGKTFFSSCEKDYERKSGGKTDISAS